MLANDLIVDAFTRVHDVVHEVVEGLSAADLAYRPAEGANTIGWIIWHLTRIQDDHIAELAGDKQVWAEGWSVKFDLPFSEAATGYGQTAEEVGQVQVDAALLLGYFDAVHTATVAYVQTLKEADYARVVDTNWEPAVTLGVRLISVVEDDMQHAGQAAYVRGLLTPTE